MIFNISEIDRAFFEAVRLRLVADNYLPDIVSIANDATFQTLIKNRREAKTPTIEVFGDSPMAVKGGLYHSRIIIEQKQVKPGTIKSGIARAYLQNPDSTYNEFRYPSGSVHIEYDIRYITDRKPIDNYCFSLLHELFGGFNNKIKGVKPDRTRTEKYFQFVFQDSFNVSGDDYIEKGLTVEVRDVFISPMVPTGTIEPFEIFEGNIIYK